MKTLFLLSKILAADCRIYHKIYFPHPSFIYLKGFSGESWNPGLEFISSLFLLSNRMLLSAPWVKVNRCKSKRWKSHHWILHNWLVWMYPEEFARPVKQKVLSQAKGCAYMCKQLLLLGGLQCFPMEDILLGSICELLCIRPNVLWQQTQLPSSFL